jgi:endonuclease/exonuclease/phosphatase family metal-dependent hydrolase
MRLSSSRRLLGLALAVAAGTVVLGVPTLGQAGGGGKNGGGGEGKPEKVTVMTRNIYLGAPLGDLFTTTSLDDLKQEAAEELAEVSRTDFPSRAKLLAAEIAAAKPDLVGLQEVVHWRLDFDDPDGSGPIDGPAKTNFQNFLEILTAELKAAGARYRVASEVTDVPDVELPVADNSGVDDEPPDEQAAPDFDGRGTFRNVILARRGVGVRTAMPDDAQFINPLVLEAGGFPVTINRGWASVEANVRGAKFRFVNTHLEAFDDGKVRRAQAKELVQNGGPADVDGQLVILGDFNTGDRQRHNIAAARDRRAFEVLDRAGLIERQTRDFSCCYQSSLTDPNDAFDHTVDHVFVNTAAIKLGRSFVTGDDVAKRTSSGLWPSDHGGVVSVLKIPTG